MIYNLIITALLIGAFFMCISAYYMGFKHAQSLQKDIIPTVIQNPVETVKTVVKEVQQIKQDIEQAKADKEYNEKLAKLWSFNGEVNDED